jgi:hypothetical protein
MAASTAAAAAIGNVLWERSTTRALRRLNPDTAASDGAAAFSPDQLTGLPAPVARYFAFALTPGQPVIRHARLRQRGEFLTGGMWHPFSAVEHFGVLPPGFLWDATIRMAPLIVVRVRDSYLDGEGSMHGRLAAIVPVVRQGGTPEMAAASLQRYLAEAVWFPTALLPSAGVRWTAVDDSTARATLADGGTTASVDFHFGHHGEIVGVATERYRAVDDAQVLTLWVGRFREYDRVHRMQVPREGEVAWALPEGQLPYWRGRMIDFKYEFAEVE